MKFSERLKAFVGDLLDGISCRLSTAFKFVKKHLIPFCIGAVVLAALITASCIFVPKLSAAIRARREAKQAEVTPTEALIVIPTSEPTPTPEPTPVPTATPEPTPTPVPLHLKKGDRNDIVYDIQRRLMELNYIDYDEPTNYFGRITKEGIEVFQRRNGLDVTGEVTEEVYSLLMSNSARLYMASLGDEGTDIKEMQKRLHELDYLEKVTGIFDEDTQAAVLEFQEKNELEVDGMVGSQTKECLYSEDAVAFSLYIGTTGDDVQMYQERLYDLGYLASKPNGIYGNNTVNAVKRFQERNDIIVDGHIGPSTKTALLDPNCRYNRLEITMGGDDVLRLQRQLYKLNYLKRSEVTGYFGEITDKAVRAFQKNNKLTVDGAVAKETFEKLFSDSAKKSDLPVSVTPTPTPTPKPTPKPTATPRPRPTATPRPGTTPRPTARPTNTPKPTATPTPTPKPGPTSQDKINNLIRIAKSKLGRPYVRGAKGPNAFDCSGFVYWCLNRAGVQQSYMTSYMWRSTSRYPRYSSMSSIKPGDVLVFKMGNYSGHVGIAVNDGMMVDASSNEGRIVLRPYNTDYWRSVFYCGYRIFGN